MPSTKEVYNDLRKLYSSIPDTKGCMENIGKCKGWCCSFQNPQVLYVEFSHVWNHILQCWHIDEIADLLEKAIRLYVSDIPTKGCIFWNCETKMCRIHDLRPFNCYIYGITPQEEFTPRYERLKQEYKDDPCATVRDQCNLVSAKNGEEVTTEDTDRWWKDLVELESSIGVDRSDINDGMEGSYRTYHDHMLIRLMPEDIFEKLQSIRLFSHHKNKVMDKREVELLILKFMGLFRSNIKNIEVQRNDG